MLNFVVENPELQINAMHLFFVACFGELLLLFLLYFARVFCSVLAALCWMPHKSAKLFGINSLKISSGKKEEVEENKFL